MTTQVFVSMPGYAQRLSSDQSNLDRRGTGESAQSGSRSEANPGAHETPRRRATPLGHALDQGRSNWRILNEGEFSAGEIVIMLGEDVENCRND